MHDYLRAIGFPNKKNYLEIQKLLKETTKDYKKYNSLPIGHEIEICEYQKEFGSRIGWSLYGKTDEDMVFHKDYYCPYFLGAGVSSYSDIIVERQSEKEAYYGICEEIKVGVNLIFLLQNVMDYLREVQHNNLPKAHTSVTLSGLATEGTILFPVIKSMEQEVDSQEESRNRMMLLSAAKQGDNDAIETLALEDMDMYQMVSKRLVSEDVLSIVESYFMPYSVECDRYSVLGEIKYVDETRNEVTNEEIYILTLNVNEIMFDVCVPKRTLIGEPEKGRRFKGNIWLQGHINF